MIRGNFILFRVFLYFVGFLNGSPAHPKVHFATEWTLDPICTAECGHDTAPHREKEEITTDGLAGCWVQW